MVEVNGKMMTEDELELLKKDPNKRIVETTEPNKFKLKEKMLG